MFRTTECISDPILVYCKNPLPVGIITQFDEEGKTIISDGSKPFGVAGDMDENNLMEIYWDTMEFQTTIFDASAVYQENDLLYVNSNGLLTTDKPFLNSLLMGKVTISPEEDNEHVLTVNWI